mgnify:CR=1 FL=1
MWKCLLVLLTIVSLTSELRAEGLLESLKNKTGEHIQKSREKAETYWETKGKRQSRQARRKATESLSKGNERIGQWWQREGQQHWENAKQETHAVTDQATRHTKQWWETKGLSQAGIARRATQAAGAQARQAISAYQPALKRQVKALEGRAEEIWIHQLDPQETYTGELADKYTQPNQQTRLMLMAFTGQHKQMVAETVKALPMYNRHSGKVSTLDAAVREEFAGEYFNGSDWQGDPVATVTMVKMLSLEYASNAKLLRDKQGNWYSLREASRVDSLTQQATRLAWHYALARAGLEAGDPETITAALGKFANGVQLTNALAGGDTEAVSRLSTQALREDPARAATLPQNLSESRRKTLPSEPAQAATGSPKTHRHPDSEISISVHGIYGENEKVSVELTNAGGILGNYSLNERGDLEIDNLYPGEYRIKARFRGQTRIATATIDTLRPGEIRLSF